jgi:hypothetical protein
VLAKVGQQVAPRLASLGIHVIGSPSVRGWLSPNQCPCITHCFGRVFDFLVHPGPNLRFHGDAVQRFAVCLSKTS